MDGEVLHGQIPPEMWCITREDLKELRRQIHAAVKEGRIKPIPVDPVTQRGDAFDPDDHTMGPNMYNVVENYIKPVTLAAGGMSWALMRHPAGIKCDIFITHSWAEGAYEFIDKVLASWPMGKRAAWCCILANPQNLDISALIQDPETSPFAKALQAASHVMVVPTRNGSIYRRIWCVYEAYLAMEWKKVIFTASAVTLRLQWILISLAVGSICAVLGYILAFGSRAYAMSIFVVALSFSTALVLLSQCFVRWSRATFCVNTSGIVASACLLGTSLVVVSSTLNLAFVVIAVLAVEFVVFFMLNEVDRLRGLCLRQEGARLEQGYAGVAYATSSCEQDKVRILSCLGDRTGTVDECVGVLINAGMSTPALRVAAARGVDVRGAGETRLGVAWLGVSLWCAVTYSAGGVSRTGAHVAVVVFAGVTLVAHISRWALAEKDERAFVETAILKIWLFSYPAGILCQIGLLSVKDLVSLCLLIGSVLAFAANVLGRRGVARIPCVGRVLAQALGPGCWWCRIRRLPPSGTRASS